MDKLTIKGWVVRDSDRYLKFFAVSKPCKDKTIQAWFNATGDYYSLYGLLETRDKALPSVKWEDSEPTECELTITINK